MAIQTGVYACGITVGALGAAIGRLGKALYEEQYPPETIRRYVRVADKFGRWLRRHGLSIMEAGEATLARYRSSTGRRKNGQLRAAGRGLPKVLRLLRPQLNRATPSALGRTYPPLLSKNDPGILM